MKIALNFKLIILCLITSFSYFLKTYAQNEFNTNQNNQDQIGEITKSDNKYIQQNLYNSSYSEKIKDTVSFVLSPEILLTHLEDKMSFLMSMNAGIDINHFFRLSLSCSTAPFTSQYNASGKKFSPDVINFKIDSFYYCGNSFIFTPFAQHIMHPNIGIFAGFGSINYTFYDSQENKISTDSATFMTFIPNIEGEINITRNILLSIEYGYRFIIPLKGQISDINSSQLGLKLSLIIL